MIRTREKSRSDLLETRKLNRVASQRYDEMVKTGYDLITGRVFWQRSKADLCPMQMKKPPSVWQKLNVGTTGTSRTYEGATLAQRRLRVRAVAVVAAAEEAAAAAAAAERMKASLQRPVGSRSNHREKQS